MAHLFIDLAGTIYAKGATEHLASGKVSRTLRLQREPKNAHDKHAVMVLDGEQKLGYIPRGASQLVATLLDRGTTVECRLVGTKPIDGRLLLKWDLHLGPAPRMPHRFRALLARLGFPVSPSRSTNQ